MFRYKLKYKKVGVLPIWKVKSNISNVGPSSERNIKNLWKAKSNVSNVGPSSERNKEKKKKKDEPNKLKLQLRRSLTVMYIRYAMYCCYKRPQVKETDV